MGRSSLVRCKTGSILVGVYCDPFIRDPTTSSIDGTNVYFSPFYCFVLLFIKSVLYTEKNNVGCATIFHPVTLIISSSN